jgi:adenine-specific DNA-methyltransferase
MPEIEAPIPASPNFEKLKAKLRELFELDKADLDFGIYRVLRQRHTEIAEFLDKHLEKTVRAALTTHGDVQSVQLKHDLEKAETAAAGAGIAPEQSPRVMELREKLAKGADLEAIADEVYSHLLTFFSRYYQGGDFLGLHRSTVHGREKYMIPYNGEEVKLIWANMDQYYIKSSDLLRDYTFHIRKADLAAGELKLDDLPDESVVGFKLIEGDTEKDNRKPDGKTTRAFVLDGEKPFEEDGNTLCISFRYREHPSERNLQDKLNADSEKSLADSLPARWKALLFATDPTYEPKDKKDTRTILQKHLRGYTAKFSFDYFIHKDLGGFLRRELDFYVKNEVMHLDDIEDAAAPKAEEYLSKIRAIRRCAMPVIQMIAQLEEFQKKLWLKKKFVVETRYCLTLDRVPESLYPDICASDDQWQEWKELLGLSEPKPKRTPEFLKANPYLMIDTRHFRREFTLKVLASIENLDASLDGVCFQSENFQALQLMRERFQEQVRCVYIDPPYNTSSSGILYKNDYKHSSWGTLMFDRLFSLHDILRRDGVVFVSIDKLERTILEGVLDAIFGRDNRVEELIWTQNTANSQMPTYSTSHEYVEVYAKHLKTVEKIPAMFREQKPGYSEIMDTVGKLNPDYPPVSVAEQAIKALFKQHLLDFKDQIEASGAEWDDEAAKQDPWKGIYNYWRVEYRDADGKWVPEQAAASAKAKLWVWREMPASAPASKQSATTKDKDHHNYRYYRPIHPKTGLGCPHPRGGWKFPLTPDPENPDRKSFTQLDADNRIAWGDDDTKSPQPKGFLHEVESNISTSAFYEYNDGEAEVAGLFGSSGLFLSPKSSKFVRRFIAQTTTKSDWVVDCFGGSGSTAHSVISFNRETHGNRKYVTCEMGSHFDTLIVPRLKKVVYSRDWREGKPQTHDSGSSHAFKIVRLEGYEDALNNLHLRRTSEQEAALARSSEAVRDQYLLGYFLDVESLGSKSLLDLTEFRDPFAYKLNIATSSAGETKETTVDLVETFNWLLGLSVKHIDTAKGFLTVTGDRRAGGRCLILWRTLSADPKADNESLDKFLTKLAVNPADTEFEFIYVNGAHTLNDPHNKVHLIEETFQRLMFDTTNFETLS